MSDNEKTVDRTQITNFNPGGTGLESDRDVVIVVNDEKAMFGRRMFNKQTGEEIPFGRYPNIDWS